MKKGIKSAPRRLFDAIMRQRSSGMRPAEEAKSEAPLALDRQSLFVIGAARSSTTVLQNALNDSRDIFLFGEPVFHDDPGTPDFAARYNAMHRAWGNQENKSSFCPAFFDGDATWLDYLRHLATLHRYIGSKIVINPEHAQETCQRVFDFQCRHFYRAHYIFTFRNPIDVLMSTRGLAELTGYAVMDYNVVLRSFVQVVALYIRMLRNLPSVSAVFHENISEMTFRALGQTLGVDLDGAVRYYDSARVRRYRLDDIPEHARDAALRVMNLYEDLRKYALEGFERVQLEQNRNQLDIRHYTPIGLLQRQVDQVLETLGT